MKIYSESEMIHAVQHGQDIEFPSRGAYEQGRVFLLDFAEYCAEHDEWVWFKNASEQVEKADKAWEPLGGWVPVGEG